MSSWTNNHILANGETKINSTGNFTEPQIAAMLSLKMLQGTHAALNDYYSVILSATTAKTLFGNKDPLNHVIKIDNKFDVKVNDAKRRQIPGATIPFRRLYKSQMAQTCNRFRKRSGTLSCNAPHPKMLH